MNVRDKLAAARLMACERFPYFRSAILALVPKPAPGLGTFGVTEHGVMFYDPAIAEQWSVEEVSAVLVHEVSHLLRRHGSRCERMQAEHSLWNKAADCEINDDLATAGLKLPTKPFEPCTPKGFGMEDGLTAEEYYRALQQQTQAQGGGKGKGKPQAGDGDGDGDGDSDEKQPGQKGKGGVAAGQCGGCAGNPGEGEGTEEAKADGRSEADLNRVRRTVAEAIRQQASKSRGTVPAGWARWADGELTPPKVPWRQKLQRAARAAMAYRPGCVDYHWTRPSRRQAGLGFGAGKPVLPALRAPLPRVAVVVDTSGSMGTDEILAAVAECRGVLSAAGAEVDLCACDAAVHELRPVRHWKEIPALIKGGGGTDMKPALDAVAERRPRPDVVIVMTDGHIGHPGEQPPFKVIWLLLGKGHNPKPSEWGECIEVDEGPAEAA